MKSAAGVNDGIVLSIAFNKCNFSNDQTHKYRQQSFFECKELRRIYQKLNNKTRSFRRAKAKL